MSGFQLSLGLRPQTLDDIVGQPLLTSPTSLFRKGLESGKLYSSIFWGPPGCGKTTTALAACAALGVEYGRVSCTQAGADVIRTACNTYKVIIFDEIQYLNKKQQQLLLEDTEHQGLSIIGCTTEYPYNAIFEGLLDRCTVYRFNRLTVEEKVGKVVAFCDKHKINYELPAVEELCKCEGSLRGVYNKVEMLIVAQQPITLSALQGLPGVSVSETGKEALISALQKSIRGSDPDASVYYLGQLLNLGELEYVCRRLGIVASEDIGLADSNTAILVTSCITEALRTGLPEAKIPLSHAVLRMALSPKSNSCTIAISEAMESSAYPPPPQIASAHAMGYVYPHDYPNAYYKFEYLPKQLQGKKFYSPKHNRWETAAADYLNRIKK